MQEEKSGIKLRIFLSALLVFLCIMLGLYVYNIVSVNKNYISEESVNSRECLNLDFLIMKAEFSNSTLSVEVKNMPSSDTQIKSITINVGNVTIKKDMLILPFEQKKALFENFNLEDDMVTVFPNNCEKYAKSTDIVRI